ncbi:hypothetical protein Tco_1082596 [Tanacetum coccineum]|uniref:Reverse transcriptase domain-containing protein n=1 Tax=Tanacetum coccineum TaxID=301880 RepID=A0ABQ5I0T8_9ASTR
MHTRASNSELVEPLPEPERTLNRRLRRRNRRVPFNQRNNPPQNPRIVYPPILDINHFRYFLMIIKNLYPMDDEPMWAADHVVAPTPSSAITILKIAIEFAIKAYVAILLYLIFVDASIRASESRAMTAVGEVNERVTDLAITQRQEAHELQVRCENAQDDRALLRAQVSLLTRERRYFCSMDTFYEREVAEARRAWAQSNSKSQAIEDQLRALQRDVSVLQRQRIDDGDQMTSHIQHEHDRFRELVRIRDAGPQEGPTDAGVATALAEYEANRGSRNVDDSRDARSGKRTKRAARECTYSDFLKCQPINFIGIEGVGNALTWWNSHVKTVSHEVAYEMTWKTLKKMMTDK